MYFGFGVFLSTNCHFMPVGKPAPPRPRSPDALTCSMTSFGCIASAFFRPVVAFVLEEEVEREAVRLADVLGENRFHSLDPVSAGPPLT